MQHYTVICDLSGCTVFFHIISGVSFLGKKFTEHTRCVLIFSTMSEAFLILIISSDIITRVHRSLICVCPCIIIIWEEENQLDATKCFELVICSTCFGHVYAHRQELTTILLVWHVACNSRLLVVRRSGAGQQAMCPGLGKLFDLVEQLPHPGRIACCLSPDLPTTSNRELKATCHTSRLQV